MKEKEFCWLKGRGRTQLGRFHVLVFFLNLPGGTESWEGKEALLHGEKCRVRTVTKLMSEII